MTKLIIEHDFTVPDYALCQMTKTLRNSCSFIVSQIVKLPNNTRHTQRLCKAYLKYYFCRVAVTMALQNDTEPSEVVVVGKLIDNSNRFLIATTSDFYDDLKKIKARRVLVKVLPLV